MHEGHSGFWSLKGVRTNTILVRKERVCTSSLGCIVNRVARHSITSVFVTTPLPSPVTLVGCVLTIGEPSVDFEAVDAQPSNS
jgi:hypothetical protein